MKLIKHSPTLQSQQRLFLNMIPDFVTQWTSYPISFLGSNTSLLSDGRTKKICLYLKYSHKTSSNIVWFMTFVLGDIHPEETVPYIYIYIYIPGHP